MYNFLLLQVISSVVIFLLLAFIIIRFLRSEVFKTVIGKSYGIVIFLLIASGILLIYSDKTYPPQFAMPMFMHTKTPAGPNPNIPFSKIIEFFQNRNRFETIEDIGADPNAVPPATNRTQSELVKIDIVAQEVISKIGDEIYFNYWTYDNQVPGPMYRVRVGDTVEVSLKNHESSLHSHNIDLHAVTGPGGGATLTNVMPGETKAFSWKALNPGLYVYHCATPNVSTHNSHGQYGMILVEPEGGLPQVDKEFYLMQGELYTEGDLGKKGLVPFDSKALLDGIPNYITFNGRLETTPRMTVNVGDKVRIYIGNGGVNLISSFHPIGEIFDTVYPEGAIGEGSAIFKNVQTTAVLPGGSAIVEFVADVPGKIVLVDHALARMNKGAWAIIDVIGEEQPDIFRSLTPTMPMGEM